METEIVIIREDNRVTTRTTQRNGIQLTLNLCYHC